MGLISDACIPIFKVLYLLFDTAGAHVHVEVMHGYTSQGLLHVSKTRYRCRLFSYMKYDHVAGAGNMIFILV